VSIGPAEEGFKPKEPGPIERAVDKMNDRKMAIGCSEEEGLQGDDNFARMMLSGYDLDLEELDFYRRQMLAAGAESLERNMREGKDFSKAMALALAGTWVDGVQTGINIGREQVGGG
jgi:hypothetical protein